MLSLPRKDWKIAVTSRSFSGHSILRSELLAKYPRSTFNESGSSLRGQDLRSFLEGHDAAIVALEPIDDALLSELPQLKIISKYGVGLDTLDLEAMAKHGVRLGWVGGVNRRSVSELALAFILSSLRQINGANIEIKAGLWRQPVGSLLTGRTIGIIGLGNIGKDLVQLLQPFCCTIYANDLLEFPAFCKEYRVEQVALSVLLEKSQVVSLHLPLTEKTRGILGKDQLATMLAGAVLINTARGGLVDEEALKECLSSGHLSAAAFDVFTQEPPEDQELLKLPNFVATPHIAGSSQESILAMGRTAIAQISHAREPLPEAFS